MRVTVDVLKSAGEPSTDVQHEQVVATLLRPGWIELGLRRSEIAKFSYDAGEVILRHRHTDYWDSSSLAKNCSPSFA